MGLAFLSLSGERSLHNKGEERGVARIICHTVLIDQRAFGVWRRAPVAGWLSPYHHNSMKKGRDLNDVTL